MWYQRGISSRLCVDRTRTSLRTGQNDRTKGQDKRTGQKSFHVKRLVKDSD